MENSFAQTSQVGRKKLTTRWAVAGGVFILGIVSVFGYFRWLNADTLLAFTPIDATFYFHMRNGIWPGEARFTQYEFEPFLTTLAYRVGRLPQHLANALASSQQISFWMRAGQFGLALEFATPELAEQFDDPVATRLSPTSLLFSSESEIKKTVQALQRGEVATLADRISRKKLGRSQFNGYVAGGYYFRGGLNTNGVHLRLQASDRALIPTENSFTPTLSSNVVFAATNIEPLVFLESLRERFEEFEQRFDLTEALAPNIFGMSFTDVATMLSRPATIVLTRSSTDLPEDEPDTAARLQLGYVQALTDAEQVRTFEQFILLQLALATPDVLPKILRDRSLITQLRASLNRFTWSDTQLNSMPGREVLLEDSPLGIGYVISAQHLFFVTDFTLLPALLGTEPPSLADRVGECARPTAYGFGWADVQALARSTGIDFMPSGELVFAGRKDGQLDVCFSLK